MDTEHFDEYFRANFEAVVAAFVGNESSRFDQEEAAHLIRLALDTPLNSDRGLIERFIELIKEREEFLVEQLELVSYKALLGGYAKSVDLYDIDPVVAMIGLLAYCNTVGERRSKWDAHRVLSCQKVTRSLANEPVMGSWYLNVEGQESHIVINTDCFDSPRASSIDVGTATLESLFTSHLFGMAVQARQAVTLATALKHEFGHELLWRIGLRPGGITRLHQHQAERMGMQSMRPESSLDARLLAKRLHGGYAGSNWNEMTCEAFAGNISASPLTGATEEGIDRILAEPCNEEITHKLRVTNNVPGGVSAVLPTRSGVSVAITDQDAYAYIRTDDGNSYRIGQQGDVIELSPSRDGIRTRHYKFGAEQVRTLRLGLELPLAVRLTNGEYFGTSSSVCDFAIICAEPVEVRDAKGIRFVEDIELSILEIEQARERFRIERNPDGTYARVYDRVGQPVDLSCSNTGLFSDAEVFVGSPGAGEEELVPWHRSGAVSTVVVGARAPFAGNSADSQTSIFKVRLNQRFPVSAASMDMFMATQHERLGSKRDVSQVEIAPEVLTLLSR